MALEVGVAGAVVVGLEVAAAVGVALGVGVDEAEAVVVGVLDGAGDPKSILLTKAFSAWFAAALLLLWNTPWVTGKLDDQVSPVTKAAPKESSATPKAWSLTFPLR